MRRACAPLRGRGRDRSQRFTSPRKPSPGLSLGFRAADIVLLCEKSKRIGPPAGGGKMARYFYFRNILRRGSPICRLDFLRLPSSWLRSFCTCTRSATYMFMFPLFSLEDQNRLLLLRVSLLVRSAYQTKLHLVLCESSDTTVSAIVKDGAGRDDFRAIPSL